MTHSWLCRGTSALVLGLLTKALVLADEPTGNLDRELADRWERRIYILEWLLTLRPTVCRCA
ncbi:MAG: hypothetical protein FJ167_10265 [Gammaproteobacteria bacterium]|nr:hypothetical protein [Gammaproteobacteria bacterium]